MLTEWINFRPFSSEYYIERGKTLPFNVAFGFNAAEGLATSISAGTVTDYSNNKYTTTIDDPEFLCRVQSLKTVYWLIALNSSPVFGSSTAP